ncbi:MAG TPA: metallophosphoesterase [Spirochaetota bacterium]|nr:metallophosphoesterase [Spirochaetota bacterium]
MLIAVTADLHLDKDHPETYGYFKKFIEQLKQQQITTVILAGDIFAKQAASYPDFVKLLNQYPDITFHAVKGNHDNHLKKKMFALNNFYLYDEPVLKKISNRHFVFIPYYADRSMAEVYREYFSEPPPSNSVLISHGDWQASSFDPGVTYENNYFLLTRGDLQQMNISKVILGHIHKPESFDSQQRVIYCGSPWPVSVNETGFHYYLLYDAAAAVWTYKQTGDCPLYERQTMFVIPEQAAELEHKVNSYMQSLQQQYDSAFTRLHVKLTVKGYTDEDTKALNRKLEELLQQYCDKKHFTLDTAAVIYNEDIRLTALTRKAESYLQRFSSAELVYGVEADDIKQQMLHFIYGEPS